MPGKGIHRRGAETAEVRRGNTGNEFQKVFLGLLFLCVLCVLCASAVNDSYFCKLKYAIKTIAVRAGIYWAAGTFFLEASATSNSTGTPSRALAVKKWL